jgi:hypothetical protein
MPCKDTEKGDVCPLYEVTWQSRSSEIDPRDLQEIVILMIWSSFHAVCIHSTTNMFILMTG